MRRPRRASALAALCLLACSPAGGQEGGASTAVLPGDRVAATTALPWHLYHRTDAVLDGLRKTALKVPARAR